MCRDKSTAGRTQSCQEASLIVDIIMLSQFHVVSNKKFLIHLQFLLYSKTEITLLKAELKPINRSVFLGSPGAVAVHVYGWWLCRQNARAESHSVVLNVSFIIIAHYNVCITGVSQSGRSDKLKSISTGQCRSRSLFTIPTVSRGLSQEEEARGFGVMRCVSVSANHSAVTSVGFFRLETTLNPTEILRAEC